ncbi:MAG: alcohol acetyltransferase [Tissierellia bacterium]|nr:alcohol acetyltransferase [Tissierellia bacterium]
MSKWFKLDNAANIYPSTQTSDWTAMFRISVTLSEDVDLQILEEAQINTLKRFPSFAARLRKGMFWHFFEQIDGAPPILDDIYNPTQPLIFRRNRYFMYRLLCHKNRISVEFFHALTDGSGAMTFLLSLVAEYLRLKNGIEVVPSKYVFRCSDSPEPEEYEDAFQRYAGDKSLGLVETPSYHYDGTAVPLNKLLIISAEMPTEVLRAKAKEYRTSIGAFLAANLLYSIYKKQKSEKSESALRHDAKISLPINLRQFFPSKTVRNFSSFINPGIKSRLGDYTFEEVLEQVEHFMGMNITEKELNARFTGYVKIEKNLLMRLVPLFLKNLLLKIGHSLTANRTSASTISNLGLVEVDEAMRPYIRRIDLMLGRSYGKRTSCGVVSYNGKTVINFSRTIVEADIEQNFFRQLVEMGIPVAIESNGRG